MDIFCGCDKLMHVILDLKLCQSLPPFYQLVQCLVVTKFQDDVNELRVFKEVLESDNIRWLNLWVNLDLGSELPLNKNYFFLCLSLCQSWLVDDLYCRLFVVFQIYDFMTYCESSLRLKIKILSRVAFPLCTCSERSLNGDTSPQWYYLNRLSLI